MVHSSHWASGNTDLVVTWQQVKKDFEPDGALRDVYIQRTDLKAWQQFLDWVQSDSFPGVVSWHSDNAQIPERVAEIFELRRARSLSLSMLVSGITFNCHFFTVDEIELDFSPEHLDSERFKGFLGFISALGNLLSKEVIVTPENAPQLLFLKFDPAAREIEFIPDHRGF